MLTSGGLGLLLVVWFVIATNYHDSVHTNLE